MKINPHKMDGCDHHRCHSESCDVKASHAHVPELHEHDSCRVCITDHLKEIVPLQERIGGLKINGFAKQFLITASFLITSIPVAKLLNGLLGYCNLDKFASSLISVPVSISTMHLSNRGKKNMDKLGLTVGSSIAALSLNKLTNMPRSLLRFIMCSAVFLIEKFRPEQLHSQDEKIRHEHHYEHESHGEIKDKPHFKIKLTKDDLISFGRIQALILAVPAVIDYFTDKLARKNSEINNFLKRFSANVLATLVHVFGLSAGFVGVGNLIDKCVKSLHLKPDENNTHGKAETVMSVCSHCGIPGCIDSITEGVDASVVQAIAV